VRSSSSASPTSGAADCEVLERKEVKKKRSKTTTTPRFNFFLVKKKGRQRRKGIVNAHKTAIIPASTTLDDVHAAYKNAYAMRIYSKS